MKDHLTKKVVKKKKLLFNRAKSNYTLIIPKKWLEELGWTNATPLVLEFLPFRRMIVISEDDKANSRQVVDNIEIQGKEAHDENEEVSDIVAI